jgi:hypothetical protein
MVGFLRPSFVRLGLTTVPRCWVGWLLSMSSGQEDSVNRRLRQPFYVYG